MSQVVPETPVDLTEIVNNLTTEDDEPVDNLLSEKQQRLLVEPLYSSWTPPPDEDDPDTPRKFWASANVGIFQSVHQPPIVPDVFLSLDVEAPEDLHDKQKRAYFLWEYGKVPEVVIEIVEHRKSGELKHKLKDYARMGATYYVVYDPNCEVSQDVLRVYEIGFGKRYRLREDYQLPAVGLSLTLWPGRFERRHCTWLRWCDAHGNLILTGQEGREIEAAARQRAEAELERLRAELARRTRRPSRKREPKH